MAEMLWDLTDPTIELIAELFRLEILNAEGEEEDTACAEHIIRPIPILFVR